MWQNRKKEQRRRGLEKIKRNLCFHSLPLHLHGKNKETPIQLSNTYYTCPSKIVKVF
jgi:hypothetical protein